MYEYIKKKREKARTGRAITQRLLFYSWKKEKITNIEIYYVNYQGNDQKDETAGQNDSEQATTTTKKDEDLDSENEDENNQSDQPLSKKKLKKLQRLDVAELKQLVKKPEAVEVRRNQKSKITNGWIRKVRRILKIFGYNYLQWWDVTAADPKLLVNLKSYRNTVPVPAHWSQKRKYLQGKRGIEKPPWELPGKVY